MTESNQASAFLGQSVAAAGDVNGDGYADVIVGAPFFDHGQRDEGRALVYEGSARGLGQSPSWTAEGDVSGDWFGRSVGTAGDVNGDGFDDVIVGSSPVGPGSHGHTGRAAVFYGSPVGLSATPDWAAESGQPADWFGASVGTAGDVNGDGFDEVIVGAYDHDHGQLDEGRAFVFNGSPTGPSAAPSWTAESNQAEALFGQSVGTAGDVNGDGYDDVIVGSFYFNGGQTEEGRAFVYQGSPAGLGSTPAWTAEGDQTRAWFGWSVGTAGDVNGDGYADVVVGARYFDNGRADEGRAFVYQGSARGLGLQASWTAEGDQSEAWFGWSVGTARDVNADGFDDLIVSAAGYDDGFEDNGRAFIYHGSLGGLADAPGWMAQGSQPDAYFGWSVRGAGDVNGDGRGEVILGVPYHDNGQTDEGRAYVYSGGLGRSRACSG
jgi:hypothetical protein